MSILCIIFNINHSFKCALNWPRARLCGGGRYSSALRQRPWRGYYKAASAVGGRRRTHSRSYSLSLKNIISTLISNYFHTTLNDKCIDQGK